MMFPESIENMDGSLIGRQYQIIQKIGEGAFGAVYKAVNTNDGELVAIKVEETNETSLHLQLEYKVYKFLGAGLGVPCVHKYYSGTKYNLLVMQLLGPSLGDLFDLCARRFSLKTVLMLAGQMIDRVQFMHKKGILHCDIKPENFVMGTGGAQNRLYIIDFGLAKKYFDSEQNAHIPLTLRHDMTGTPRYASPYTLMRYELSRRDDMISLGYNLIYFLRGSLPWQGIVGPCRQRYELLAEKKLSITPEELCKGFPDEFVAYLYHCQQTEFDKPPNYLGLRRSFCDLFSRLKYVHDDVYDWLLPIDQNKAHAEEDKDEETNKIASSKSKLNMFHLYFVVAIHFSSLSTVRAANLKYTIATFLK